MTDASLDAAGAEAAPAAMPAPDPGTELKARLQAEAAARHAAELAEISDLKDRVDAALRDLGVRLQASIDKAKKDPGHTGYASTFLIDVEVKAREIVAWIDRHVGTDGPA